MNEVLVVGAGPVGLVTACELARQGLRPRLIDILDVPNTQSRAVGLHARSQEMLDALGVLPRIEARARRIVAIELCRGQDAGRPLARIDVTGLATRRSCLLDLPQTATEEVLRERAAELGIGIERGTAVAALHQDSDGVEVTLRTPRGEETTRVGWVVGTDGAHSTTRRLAGTALAGSFHGQRFLLADVDIETGLSPDTMRMFAHPDGVTGIFPMAGRRARLMFAVDAPGAGDPTLEQVQDLIDTRMGVPLTVVAAHWLTYFEVRHGQVPQYRFGRVLLAGDAAHIHSPAGGQGMNTGMQDGANLAWKLALVAGGRADPALLDSYHAERHPVGAAVIRSTTAMTTMLTSTGVAAAARDAALLVAGHVHKVGDAVAGTLAEVTVGYRDSAIVGSAGRRSRGAPRPGTHAPDPAGLTDAHGDPAWIGDLLRRPGHLLLVRSNDPAVVATLHVALGDVGTVTRVVTDPGAAQAGDLVDTATAIQRYYGIGDDGFVLIRPDGYIGLLAAPADPAILTNHLTEALRIRTAALR